MAISIKEAIKTITSLHLNLNYEIIPIEESSKRISAQNIKSTSCLPKFNNSAMDGYGIIYENRISKLKIIEKIFAGDNSNTILEKNTCVNIMTGAKIPSNCDTIIPKEDCKINNDNTITVPKNIKKNQHIRFIGEDIKKGEYLLKEGDEINFSKITLLASQGVSHIKVFQKPNITVFASGEELKLHYEKTQEHQIYNSNTPTFLSRAKELGAKTTFIGQAHDSIKSIKQLITNSLNSNLIITSGGMSVGDADFTRASFNELSFETLLEGILIKPGKPTVLGKIGDTLILNLPGNPLASALIFEVFGRLLLQKLIGSNEIHHNFIEAKIYEDLKNKKGRVTIIPGFFDGSHFKYEIKRNPGMVSTLSRSNSLIILDENVTTLKKNDLVKVLPINWKFFTKNYKDFLTYEK